jgi:hypothetical protein
VNLNSHQKAAYKILTELHTPQTMMQSEMDRVIFDWYSRFDLFAGFMAGGKSVLSRHWFVSYHQYYLDQVRRYPGDLIAKMDEAIANYRLLAMELMFVFADREKGDLYQEDFLQAMAALTLRFNSWYNDMDPSLTDPIHRVVDFSCARPRDPDDIVDPYAPGVLFKDPLWRMNYAVLGWCSTDIMIKQQTARMTGTAPSAELTELALQVCQRFEAIEYWPGSPKGSLLSAQASLGIAVLLLPKDERHTMWFRRKLALIESMGYSPIIYLPLFEHCMLTLIFLPSYIFAPSFRNKMAELWSLPDIQQWWLPNYEGCPRIVRSIRSFVDERATLPTDSTSSDLKEMRGIFRAMKLSDDDSSRSPSIAEQHPHHQMSLNGGSASGNSPAANALGAAHGPIVWPNSPEGGWDVPHNMRS